METLSFFSIVFLLSFLCSTTAYSIIIGFGPGKEKLKDPFDEHEK